MAEGGPSKSKSRINFGNKFGRAVERLKEKVGISEKITDVEFEHCEALFKTQEKNAHKLEKVLKHFINETKQFERVTKEVAEEINKIWEDEWNEKPIISGWTQEVGLTFEKYSRDLEKEAYEEYLTYTKEFPILQKLIKKREVRRVDLSRRRKEWDTLDQKSANVKEEKLEKAKFELHMAEKEFNECHSGLMDKLPQFHENRVEIMSKTFKTLAVINAGFYEEMAKLFERLGTSSDNLRETGNRSISFQPFVQRPLEIEKPNGFKDEKPAKQEKKDEKKLKRPGLEQVFQVEVPKANFIEESHPDYVENPTVMADFCEGVRKSEENSDVLFASPSMKFQDGIFDATQSPPTHQTNEEIPSHIGENSKLKEVQESNIDVKSNKKVEKKDNLKEPKNLLYKVKVSHQYEAEDNDEIDLDVGDIIYVVPFDNPDDADEGWRMGIVAESGKKGLFPENFTKKL